VEVVNQKHVNVLVIPLLMRVTRDLKRRLPHANAIVLQNDELRVTRASEERVVDFGQLIAGSDCLHAVNGGRLIERRAGDSTKPFPHPCVTRTAQTFRRVIFDSIGHTRLSDDSESLDGANVV
jgi:hypothetical protein